MIDVKNRGRCSARSPPREGDAAPAGALRGEQCAARARPARTIATCVSEQHYHTCDTTRVRDPGCRGFFFKIAANPSEMTAFSEHHQ